MTNSYNIQYNENVSIILNWFGREGLLFMQALNDEEWQNVKLAWDCLKSEWKIYATAQWNNIIFAILLTKKTAKWECLRIDGPLQNECK